LLLFTLNTEILTTTEEIHDKRKFFEWNC